MDVKEVEAANDIHKDLANQEENNCIAAIKLATNCDKVSVVMGY